MNSRTINSLRGGTAIAWIISAALLILPVSVAHAQHEGHSAPTASQQTSAAETVGEEVRVVEIPLDKQQLIGVKTVAVSFRQIGKVIRTVGRVDYDERMLATVNMKYEGWIEKLYADYTGMQVRKGQPLAEVYSPELLSTQQEFLNTLRWAKSTSEAKEGVPRRSSMRHASGCASGTSPTNRSSPSKRPVNRSVL